MARARARKEEEKKKKEAPFNTLARTRHHSAARRHYYNGNTVTQKNIGELVGERCSFPLGKGATTPLTILPSYRPFNFRPINLLSRLV